MQLVGDGFGVAVGGQDHQLWMQREDRLQRGIRHAPHLGFAARRIGTVADRGDADHPVAEAEPEKDFGDGRSQGNDPLRSRRHGRSVEPQQQAAEADQVAQGAAAGHAP